MISFELKFIEIVLVKGLIVEGGDELIRIVKDFYQFKKSQTHKNFHLQAQVHKVVGKHFKCIGEYKLANVEFGKALQIYKDLNGANDLTVLEMLCFQAENVLKINIEEASAYVDKIQQFIEENKEICQHMHLGFAEKVLGKYFL